MADVSDYREEFEWCKNALSDNHRTALDDIEFADLLKQWPEEIGRRRMAAHRPVLTISRLAAFKRQVVNDARQNKPSINVMPVDDHADPETADVISGIIRNIEAISNADVAYDTASEQAVGGGFGFWRVDLDYAFDDSFDLDIIINRIINQFSVYPDPNSTAADSSDWDITYVTDRVPRKKFEKLYKGKAETDFDSDAWSRVDAGWLSDEGVLVAERWCREDVEREAVFLTDGRIFDLEDFTTNDDLQRALFASEIEVRGSRSIRSKKVTQCIMSGVDILKEASEFPCRYIPIVPVYGSEILFQGKRYWRSLIHDAKDAQQAYNYFRSTSAEVYGLTPKVPYIGPEGAFSIDEGWDTANTDNHAYLEYKGTVPPQRQPLDTGPAVGAIQEAMNASDDMKAIMGLYDASLGARSNETSGKAIMARQREGDVSTFHFQDNLNRAIRHTGKILVDMIPRVYTGERVMRVLGEDGSPRNVKVNAPYEIQGDDGQPVTEEVETQEGPVLRAVTAMHDLSTGKYDVVVKAGPSFTTRREEAAYFMTEAVRSAPNTAPVLIPEIAEMQDWPGAQKIAEQLREFMNPNAGGPSPEIQQMIEAGKAQIEQLTQENQELKAKLGDKTAQNLINMRKVDNEARNNAEQNEIARFNAETNRMDTEIDVAGAQQRKAFGLPIS